MPAEGHIIGQSEFSAQSERAHLESSIRGDYERCHPDDTFEDLKRRSHFSKEDKGLLRDWMALAIRRRTTSQNDQQIAGFNMAA